MVASDWTKDWSNPHSLLGLCFSIVGYLKDSNAAAHSLYLTNKEA